MRRSLSVIALWPAGSTFLRISNDSVKAARASLGFDAAIRASARLVDCLRQLGWIVLLAKTRDGFREVPFCVGDRVFLQFESALFEQQQSMSAIGLVEFLSRDRLCFREGLSSFGQFASARAGRPLAPAVSSRLAGCVRQPSGASDLSRGAGCRGCHRDGPTRDRARRDCGT